MLYEGRLAQFAVRRFAVHMMYGGSVYRKSLQCPVQRYRRRAAGCECARAV